MPAWITSLLRELMPVPKLASASSTSGAWPRAASSAATASPTTPAPITTVSTDSISATGAGAAYAGPARRRRARSEPGGRHRHRGSVRLDRDGEVHRIGHEAVAVCPLVEGRELVLVLRIEGDARAQGDRHEAGLAVLLAPERADGAVGVREHGGPGLGRHGHEGEEVALHERAEHQGLGIRATAVAHELGRCRGV